MFHLYKFDRCSLKASVLIVGKNTTMSPNLLPQKNTKCPFPFNRLRIGESLWFHHAEVKQDTLDLATAAAKRFNKTYKLRVKGEMFAFVDHPGKTEIVRIR